MPDDDNHCSRDCRSPDVEAREAAARYETVSAEHVNDWLIDLLPHDKACILDVGSGSGRDAAWLASLGHEVIAVEPNPAMRRECERLHPHNTFRLLTDRLPDLSTTFRTGLSFDFILVNAVWMFVAPSHRERAFRKLVTLLKPGGKIAITLRRGPVDVDRGMHPASTEEIERLARRHGAYLEPTQHAADFLGRRQISWTRIIVRVPDDGTGALPLIRRIVLNDDKSSTYKLALLRTICRVAHSAPGFAREVGDFVEVPLGIVALFWLRLYMPLLRANVPQNPNNTTGFEKLGFAKAALAKLNDVSPLDLRAGGLVGSDRQRAMHESLRDACVTIQRMPAAHLTYDDNRSHGDDRIFPVERSAVRMPNVLRLDGDYLWSFGRLSVPVHLWRAMQRYAVWIEPALIEEWVRLSLRYVERQNRSIDEGSLRTTMQWIEPIREVDHVRRRAVDMLDDKQKLFCIWTGKTLYRNSLDIDHCFPWSAWPCGDLWNLMPSSRSVNQHQKRDLLPNEETLRKAKDRVVDWWGAGYCAKRGLGERFRLEASARLPAIGSASDLEDVFVAVGLQRLRLSNDQQIPEWGGPD
ncbi:MAG: class I SAM-dependent methyltransferase [Gammaproteobacteria bacterium]|nr:class I SAM-dependent methyltransferase [Gammaproteobacteria bacterium]